MVKKLAVKSVLMGIILCLVLALVLSGCSTASTTTKSTTTNPVVSTPTTTPPVSTTSTTQAPNKNGGILKIGYSVDANVIGYPPNMPRSDAYKFATTAIESLVRTDPSGNIIPWLASSWKIDSTANTITFTLQPGIKFHDGTDFNAAAVQWNLQQCIAAKRTELAAIASVDVVDPLNVRLNLSKWDATLMAQLATSSAGLMISPTAFQNAASTDADRAAWCEKNPVGTGPFKFVSWQRDVKQVYTKFAGYWQQGKPYLDEVDWVIIANPTTELAALKTGEIDVMLEVPAADANDLQKSGQYTVFAGGGDALYSLVSDSGNPGSPFADTRVRQAVEYAIDKEAIASSIGQGSWTAIYQGAKPGSWAENSAVTGYHYDAAKAKQLLADAGYNANNPLKIKLYALTAPQYIADQMGAIQGYLSAVNIQGDVQLQDQGAFFNTFFKPGWQGGLILAPTGVRPDELGMLNWIFGSATSPSPILLPMARTADVQGLIAQAMTATDFTAKQNYVKQAQKLIVDQYCTLTWLFQINNYLGESKKIHDDGMYLSGTSTAWRPENAWKGQ